MKKISICLFLVSVALATPVRKFDLNEAESENALPASTNPFHPWRAGLNYFYDVIMNPTQFFVPEHVVEESNRHKRSNVGEARAIQSIPRGESPENLLLRARKLIDPEILEKIDLSDPDQYNQLVDLLAKEQAKNAQYSFAYAIQDEINDSYSDRTEERRGTSVKGSYSYSNGHTRTNVTYEADEFGYRVTSIETEDIGPPKPNKFGVAMVQQVVSGIQTKYAIQAQPKENTDDNAEGRDSDSGVELVDITDDFIVDEEDSDELPNYDESVDFEA